MNAPQETLTIPQFSEFQPGEKAAVVVSLCIARDFFEPELITAGGVHATLRYTVRIRLCASLHARPLPCPSLRHRGSIPRHQTNLEPESFARSILLSLPTRAICRLFGAQQLDQGRERMDRH